MAARSITLAVREKVPADLLVEIHLMILEGHDPILEKDKRTTSGWIVKYNTQGEIKPTLEQKMKAAAWLTDRGWGQAVQQIALEAELRHVSVEQPVNLPAGISAAAIAGIRDWLRLDAGTKPVIDLPAVTAPATEVIDAEYIEVTGEEAKLPAPSTLDDSTNENA